MEKLKKKKKEKVRKEVKYSIDKRKGSERGENK